MDLNGYLHILKRRWLLVALPFAGALLAAGLTLPEQQPTSTGAPISDYTATATLIASPSFTGGVDAGINMATVALFAGLGEVPERAADLLEYVGEPQVLASTVNILSVPDTGTLTITATDSDPEAAAARANAFAQATTEYFKDQQAGDAKDRVEKLTQQLDITTRRLQRARNASEADPDNPILEARVTAYQTQYAAQFGELSSLSDALGGDGPVSVLQQGVPIPKAVEGFIAPTSPVSRFAIAGLLGLLLGIALALVVERLDSRLRTRDQSEDAYGLPVLAEVPPKPWSWRADRTIHSAERPASDTAEAHRSLRSAVLLLHPELRDDGAAGHLVLMVSSAQPGEGKTTTVANLAAVMAEAGRSVLVLSLDLRSPRLHEYFEIENGAGMAEVLRGDAGLRDVVEDTSLTGVQIVTSGQRQEHPGALLSSIDRVIEAARELADVVIVDTPPLLTVTDAVDIGQHVDAVLLTCRLNRTTYADAGAAFRIITRLGLPAIGLVLVGSTASASAEGYRYGDTRASLGRRIDVQTAVDATIVGRQLARQVAVTPPPAESNGRARTKPGTRKSNP